MFPLSKGRVSKQAHVGLPDGTYEEEHGREAFDGRASHLYRTHLPTAWVRIDGPLSPHAYDLNGLKPPDMTDAAGEWLRILYNDDVSLYVSRRSEPMSYYLRDSDGDKHGDCDQQRAHRRPTADDQADRGPDDEPCRRGLTRARERGSPNFCALITMASIPVPATPARDLDDSGGDGWVLQRPRNARLRPDLLCGASQNTLRGHDRPLLLSMEFGGKGGRNRRAQGPALRRRYCGQTRT